MFYCPNGARELYHSDRAKISGQILQTKLLSENQIGYSCIRIFVFGRVLLFCGGISE